MIQGDTHQVMTHAAVRMGTTLLSAL